MCGIAGSATFSPAPRADLEAAARRQARTLAHRGPDDEGAWTDEDAGLALGFARLSILDLSAAGRQPMLSASSRYVAVLNGEIFNFLELRAELEALGHAFRSRSDTEVLLAAVEQWGLEAAVRRFVGMFAIALWDRERRVLHLVRDRVGIKPMHYGWAGGAFLFGSELKALRAHPAWHAGVDRGALALFLRYSYVPAPYTIYEGVWKLPPGTILSVSEAARDARPVAYWSAQEVYERSAAEPFRGTFDEAAAALHDRLLQAVRLRLLADVPLGAFLSGGIDSATVVALMQQESAAPVRTFTIGFDSAAYDEAADARAVARHLGTDHTELYVTAAEALAVVPRLPAIYDEPLADPSQVPTFLLAQLARRSVTVSLSGDGGDELFGGYPRYLLAERLWRRSRKLPPALLRGAAGVRGNTAAALDGLARRTTALLPAQYRLRRPFDALHRYGATLAAGEPHAFLRALVSHWDSPEQVVLGAGEPPDYYSTAARRPALSGIADQMMAADLAGYLPDDILAKLDRASMAVGLEARVPLLDHRVVEFAASLPAGMKLRDGAGKAVLRAVLERYVPRALFDRPKMGFVPPLAGWLRGELRGWAEDLLSEDALHRQGFFAPAPIRQAWREHLEGKADRELALWCVLVFQAWYQEWGSAPAGTSARSAPR